MRADAEKNAAKLRAAAAEVFAEQGVSASLKEIARRAGVSHGTLYNIFGTREALIDDVLSGIAAETLGAVADEALGHEDAWVGFCHYVRGVCDLLATNVAVGDVLTRRVEGVNRLDAVCARTNSAAENLIDAAKEVGRLRTDYTHADLLLLFGTVGLLTRDVGDLAPVAWPRLVTFLLDGLRVESASSPPAEVDMYRVVERLGRG